MLKDMADATGIVARGRAGPARRRARRRGARASRSPPGWRRAASRCASCTSPTGSWSASSAGRPPRCRGRRPRDARHHHPRRRRVVGVRPAAAGSRACASATARGCRRPVRHVHRHRAGDRARSPGRARPCDRGVVVDDDLAAPTTRTCTPSATAPSRPPAATGLVAQGWQQASRLVAALDRPAPRHRARPRRTHDVVRVKASGMSMVSMGVCGDFDRDDPRYRVLSLKDPERGRYVEVVVARRAPRRRDLHRRRRRRRHALGPRHPLAAGARRPARCSLVRALAGGAPRASAATTCAAARSVARRRPRSCTVQPVRRRRAHPRDHRLRRLRASSRLADWLRPRPGAEHAGCGDCAGVGVARPWSRRTTPRASGPSERNP